MKAIITRNPSGNMVLFFAFYLLALYSCRIHTDALLLLYEF